MPRYDRFTLPLLLFSPLLFLAIDCNAPPSEAIVEQTTIATRARMPEYRGLSFVAPPQEFAENPMPAVRAVGANYITVIPYAFTRKDQPRVYYNSGGQQWWGERPEGVQRTIELAQAAGIKVMLKPQVYIPGSWTGDLGFATPEAWSQWEADYEAYLIPLVELAQELGVAGVCIGTEFKIGAVQRETFWRNLIAKVRSRFSGTVAYASNWDAYQNVPFWDAVDVVGINAYFPLDPAATPSVAALVRAWQPWKQQIAAFQARVQKPIVFTEYGYLTVDGAAHNTWELEAKVNDLPINEQAQANALTALYAVFWAEPWWEGGFLWKWFPGMRGHEGYPARDYTPQGKLGARVLTDWYTPATATE